MNIPDLVASENELDVYESNSAIYEKDSVAYVNELDVFVSNSATLVNSVFLVENKSPALETK